MCAVLAADVIFKMGSLPSPVFMQKGAGGSVGFIRDKCLFLLSFSAISFLYFLKFLNFDGNILNFKAVWAPFVGRNYWIIFL